MKKIAFLSLILPLAACMTQQQEAQFKSELLAHAQATCDGSSNIRCLNGVVARNAANMTVARQDDGSLTLRYAHITRGQNMPGEPLGTADAATRYSFQ